MVSTAQTGSTQTSGVHVVYRIFGPAVSVSTSPLQACGADVVGAVCRTSASTAIHHRGEGVAGAVRGPSVSTTIYHLFRPAMSMSSARRADHRHSPPYTPRWLWCRRHRARTIGIHRQTQHFPPPDTTSSGSRSTAPEGKKAYVRHPSPYAMSSGQLPALLRQYREGTHGHTCGDNLKGVAYHRFLNPSPPVCRHSSFVIGPLPTASW